MPLAWPPRSGAWPAAGPGSRAWARLPEQLFPAALAAVGPRRARGAGSAISFGAMALNPVDAMDAPLDRSWTADALCHEYADLDWFGESVAAVEACSAVCRRCPVRAECWQYTLNVR